MKHNWTLDELIDSWTLLPNELELIGGSKADHNRLAFALLLKYFQIEGKFPRPSVSIMGETATMKV